MVPFEARLKLARARKGITQRQSAEAVGIAAHTYQQYESGNRRPNYECLVAIADYLDVTTDYLLGRTDRPD